MEYTFNVAKDGNVLNIVLGEELNTSNAPALMDELNK